MVDGSTGTPSAPIPAYAHEFRQSAHRLLSVDKRTQRMGASLGALGPGPREAPQLAVRPLARNQSQRNRSVLGSFVATRTAFGTTGREFMSDNDRDRETVDRTTIVETAVVVAAAAACSPGAVIMSSGPLVPVRDSSVSAQQTKSRFRQDRSQRQLNLIDSGGSVRTAARRAGASPGRKRARLHAGRARLNLVRGRL